MKRSFALLCCCLSFHLVVGQQISLMPQPQDIRPQPGQVWIDQSFSVGVGFGSDRLKAYCNRFISRVDQATGLFVTNPKILHEDSVEYATVYIEVQREGNLQVGEDESYALRIENNSVLISAETDLGAMHALETLLQLIQSDNRGYYFPSLIINDEPRFTWRGLMIDFGRHWMPMDVVLRNLDAMSMMKMNVLHMHLSEDQGFRIESKAFPKLHELGSNGDYFTQDEIRKIVRYAGDRGIRVVPEFDMPGHTTSWFVGYPELASGPGPYEIETDFGIKDPSIDPTQEYVYEFLGRLFDDILPLFPDEFVHIGGDENTGNQWDANPAIQSYMQANGITDNHELQSMFNTRLLELLQNRGKRMMGWDEIFQEGISNDILIQSWRGRESLENAAGKGYQVILSNGYYIDLARPASHHYTNDPIPDDTPLNAREQEFILGGEATMWSELVTPETVDSRIWPRTAAIAERLWSASSVNDVDDMYLRLDQASIRLEALGLKHISFQDKILRVLMGSHDISNIKTLVTAIEPLQGPLRHRSIDFQTYSPYTRLADATPVESRKARAFGKRVDLLIAGDATYLQDLKDDLLVWIENHRPYLDRIHDKPILKDSEKLSLDLSNVSKIGLQALSTTVDHSETWKANAYKSLEAARQPRMECEIVIVDHVKKLVDFAK